MNPRKAFLLRVSPELHQAIERWAAEELRSVNGQIEYLLMQAVRRSGRGRDDLAPPGGEAAEGGSSPPGDEAAPDATGIP